MLVGFAKGPGLPLFLAALAVAAQKDVVWPLKIAALEYPDLARRAKVQGDATMKCQVDAHGIVQRAEMTRGHALFRKPLESNLTKWRFVPGDKQRTIFIDFSFRLEGSCDPGNCKSNWTIELPSHVTVISELAPLQP